ITLTNADGQPITGTVVARISRVQDSPKSGEVNSLDAWYQDAPDKTVISTQTLTFSAAEAKSIQLPAVPEGIYRLTLKAQQAETQSVIFVVADEQSSLKLPAIALPQHTTYYPGETARILLGSTALLGSKQVEIYHKGQFLSKTDRLSQGLSVYSYSVTEQDRGGLGINWFGASDYQFYQAAATVTVPFDNQEIVASLDVPTDVKPGQAVSWTLTAKDKKQSPINGQASISVYDKSLDYYAQKNNPFTLSSLFSQHTQAPSVKASYLPFNAIEVFTGKSPYKWYQPVQLPTLNLVMQHVYYKNFRATRGMMLETAVAPMAMMAKSVDGGAREELATYGSANMAMDTVAMEEDSTEVGSTPDIRTEFAETAYFNTLLPVKNGKASIHFTFPQSVTTWNVLGFVLTKTAQFGAFSANTITRKDFMVQLHLPRFYREQDKGVIQASVANLTNRKITVPVTLSIKQDGQDKANLFGLQAPTKTISVAPNSTGYVQWDITAPSNPGLYHITAVGRSGADSDGEQRTLPIFTTLARLLASTHTALKNGNNTLTITELSEVPDAQAQLATLTVHPSLALSVLNSMPNVLSSPNKDLISSSVRCGVEHFSFPFAFENLLLHWKISLAYLLVECH
ncbi:MAG: hypothetical protein IJ266_00680, partial [Elusimicrobiaceae bacterium]|nr:hypothetical protein [Elusimicrobiaceae bacterium]